MKGKYIKITPDGEASVCDSVSEKPELKWLQGEVGGLVERIELPACAGDYIDLFGYEEAFLKEGYEINEVGSEFATGCLGYEPAESIHPITGTKVKGYLLAGTLVILGYDGKSDWCWLNDKQVDSVLNKFNLAKIAKKVKGV